MVIMKAVVALKLEILLVHPSMFICMIVRFIDVVNMEHISTRLWITL